MLSISQLPRLSRIRGLAMPRTRASAVESLKEFRGSLCLRQGPQINHAPPAAADLLVSAEDEARITGGTHASVRRQPGKGNLPTVKKELIGDGDTTAGGGVPVNKKWRADALPLKLEGIQRTQSGLDINDPASVAKRLKEIEQRKAKEEVQHKAACEKTEKRDAEKAARRAAAEAAEEAKKAALKSATTKAA